METNRLAWLDYLRGLCALSIMLYHYSFWSFGDFPSETFLGKVGVYGVSMFYILSGLTLFHVYNNKLEPTFPSVRNFFIKRFFRIYPLLWLVTISALILARTIPNAKALALNLTGLFGFFKWDVYFATGAWSIGNELVFYVLFPFLLFFSRKKKLFLLGSIVAIFLIVYVFFAFGILGAHKTLAQQWTNYINPLNQAFLFVAGFLIGFLNNRFSKFGKRCNALVINGLLVGGAITAVLVFIFYPTVGDAINIVIQWNRLIFTLLCCCVCICFYKCTIRLPLFLHYPLSKLGEATYSVYLIHPIVWSVVHFFKLSIPMQFVTSIVITILSSLIVYHFFEKKFINMGNNIIRKNLK